MAGVLGTLGPLESLLSTQFEETIEVNPDGKLASHPGASHPGCTSLQRPRAPYSFTSASHQNPQAFWGAYQASKPGLKPWSFGWADEIPRKCAARQHLRSRRTTHRDARRRQARWKDPMTLPTADVVPPNSWKLVSVGRGPVTGQRIRYRDLHRRMLSRADDPADRFLFRSARQDDLPVCWHSSRHSSPLSGL